MKLVILGMHITVWLKYHPENMYEAREIRHAHYGVAEILVPP
jgi:hypothetical protein